MKYSVGYTITLVGMIEVEAASEEEARSQVDDDMSAERLCLNAADYVVLVDNCEPVDDEEEDPTP